jgi:hypothetical protein
MRARHARNLHYGLAVLVLAASAVGMQVARSRDLLVVVKKPLPIRKPLRDLDRGSIAPFKFVSARKLDQEMEIEMGTAEYLDWILESPGGSRVWRDPVFLSATYYTGKQDQVPHVPEECLWQGGLSPAEGDASFEVASAETGDVIRIHRVAFYPAMRDGTKLYDYYTIRVNGSFFSSRNTLRPFLAVPGETHLYYSKVEVMFQGVRDEDLRQVDETALELLRKTADELLKSHYPLKGWEKGGPPQ